ncbi:MAG: CAAX prenyl protease-related protein [Planctomycetota bacterium]
MTQSKASLQNQDSDLTSQEVSAVPFVLPFVLYMLIASRSPSLGPESIDDVEVNQYFYIVIAQLIATVAITIYFIRSYLRQFPFRIDIWGVIVGVLGVVLWVGICHLNLERELLEAFGFENSLPERVGFNPFLQMTDSSQRLFFLICRFSMLAIMVPIVEELFLRGWLVRYFADPEGDFHQVKLSDVGRAGIIAAAVYGVATHPGEALAAFVWFSMVTVLMIRTGKFWNCVLAHAVTNLLLGIYVIFFEAWHLW